MVKSDYCSYKLRVKKSLSFIFVLLIFTSSLFAASGFFFGKKDIRVTKTQWFDIIYLPESQKMAGILYENADEVYEDVASQYNLSPEFRMPLVIVPTVDSLNAFWSGAPYNHIVIYDTSIAEVDEMATYSETILSVLRHEMTHAVTYNMKNSFWKGVSRVFGDPVAPGMLTVSTGIAEGATLTSESAAGEGRLNDEYSKQAVKQAKLEKKFPSYYDVKGASDKYPYGSSYYFNGAFHQWLQENYGMEAYSQFWFSIVNGEKLLINSSFKKAFGISIKKAWKKFLGDYEVPEINADPLATEGIQDFFVPAERSYSKNNKNYSIYRYLTESDSAVYWIDDSCDKIQFVNKEKLNRKKIKPETLFYFRGIREINVSKDDRFIALSYLSGNDIGYSARIKIYDRKTKDFFQVPETGLKNASIISWENRYFLVANKYENSSSNIAVYELQFEKRKISSVELVQKINFPINNYCFEFTQKENGQFAYVKKSGLSYSICVSSVNKTENSTQEDYEYEVPKDRMVISSLSARENQLFFSWTEPGSMPRLGIIDEAEQKMYLATEDLSGGVYEPLAFSQEPEVYYIGHFYEQNRLLKMQTEKTSFEELSLKKESEAIIEAVVPENMEVELEYKKYNPFNYIKRGIFIPFSEYTTEYFGCNSKYESESANYLLGLTYITGAPWTSGAADLYTITAGWNYLNNSFGVGASIQLGTETSLLSSQINVKSEFDDSGWKMSAGGITLQSSISFGKISNFVVSNQFLGRIGRQDKRVEKLTVFDEFNFGKSGYFKCCASEDDTVYSSLSDVFILGYTNVHKSTANRFNKAGITAKVGLEYRKDEALNNYKIKYTDAFNIRPSFTGYIPGFLPTRINFDLLPAMSSYGYSNKIDNTGNSVFDFKTETIFWGKEIQHAAPLINALYMNDFSVSGGFVYTLDAADMTVPGFQMPHLREYLIGAVKGNAHPHEAVYIKSSLEFTPNIGLLADSNYKMSFYTILSYSFKIYEVDQVPLSLYLGIQMNY